jgi:membrane-bound ClpP family serine protease
VNAVALLLLVGLLMLGFEVFIPGGVLGVIGGAAMFAGCGLAFYRFGSTAGTLTTVGSIGVLGAMLWAEMVLLPKTRLGKKLLLHKAIGATSQPVVADATTVVGRDCEAVTALAPSGFVLLDGRRYEAWSQSGFVVKGATLRVVGLDNFRLIVTKP